MCVCVCKYIWRHTKCCHRSVRIELLRDSSRLALRERSSIRLLVNEDALAIHSFLSDSLLKAAVSAAQTKSCCASRPAKSCWKEKIPMLGPIVKNLALCASRCIFARTCEVSMVRLMKGITQKLVVADREYRKSDWGWAPHDGGLKI